MKQVTIHESGNGSDKLQIVSHGNGTAYSANMGESGHSMRNLFFQGDDATHLRTSFDKLESAFPNTLSRELWFEVLDSYL